MHLIVQALRAPLTPISETSDDSFMDMINTKLTGCFLGLKAQIPVMREKGGRNR